jgi:polyphosphate kinase
LIDREMDIARSGRSGRLIAKMNALEDEKMIHRLYDAGVRSVEIDLIVRGICRLVPGVPLQSDRIRIRSIVDRFLEHARVYVFQNDGDELVYLASADWMKRNLSRRVEVAFPIYDERAREELREMLDLQLRERWKAALEHRRLNSEAVEEGR